MIQNRLFILIALLAAVLAGLQMSRRGCPACVLLPREMSHPSPKPETANPNIKP